MSTGFFVLALLMSMALPPAEFTLGVPSEMDATRLSVEAFRNWEVMEAILSFE
jgi:hypothetical protein